MKSVKLLTLGLLVAVAAAGCGPQPTTPATGGPKPTGGKPKEVEHATATGRRAGLPPTWASTTPSCG